ncbi:MAG: class D sortase [Clostridium sp.]|uniref:class D sortase n=1 Tax=Clostridium sp. TaxID=1506 RepID=UPI003D6D1D56
MNKIKLSRGKGSIIRDLSLGIIVLGIGCISWAGVNIWKQSNYAENITPKPIAAKVSKLDAENTPKAKLDTSLAVATSHKAIYAVYPSEGDNIGSLTIPALKRKLPILQGTGSRELKKGVGHFNQSVLPGEKDNCVLSGHRDTVFRQIGNLNIKDQLIVQTSAGTFTYEVSGTRIVHADDKTVIVPTDHAVLTITTCYPFDYIGNAPDRYIIFADLIKSK